MKIRSYRVIVAQTESTARNQLVNALSAHAHLSVVGVTENGLQVLSMVRILRPDLVIVDAVLAGLDGLGVLSHLNSKEFSHVQRMFLSDFRMYVQSQAVRLGADLIIQTPAAAARIASLALGLLEEAPLSAKPSDEDILQETKRILLELFPQCRPSRVGITDVSNGVLLLLRGKCDIHDATKILYPAIGACRGASWTTAERSMRLLINDIWTFAPLETLERTFPQYFRKSASARPKPTNLSFLTDLKHLVAGRLHGSWEEFDRVQQRYY